MGGGSACGTVRRHADLVAALNQEWMLWADRPLPAIERWAEREPALRPAGTADEVLAQIPGHPDRILRLLITLDHEGCEPAGRIVLQTMLGKMVGMARRDPRASVDDYVVQLWCRIRSYPLSERPIRIAANLALDTLKAVRADRVRPEPRPGPYRPAVGSGDLSAAQVLQTAAELGLVDVPTLRILLAVYHEGCTGKEVAERLQISHGMVRFRCSRAVRALSREAVTLAAAA